MDQKTFFFLIEKQSRIEQRVVGVTERADSPLQSSLTQRHFLAVASVWLHWPWPWVPRLRAVALNCVRMPEEDARHSHMDSRELCP